MPLRLDIKKLIQERSDRVKTVELHPTEPWVLTALYSGNVTIWNYETQAVHKTLEVCQHPVRAAKFIPRMQQVVTASDDKCIRVFNYNTLECVKKIEDAHKDYIRCLAVHSTNPWVLSSSDDATIKLWNWEQGWNATHTFEGHVDYVMMVSWNPKDKNTFCSRKGFFVFLLAISKSFEIIFLYLSFLGSGSLDHSIKIWGAGTASTTAHYTLTGHTKGVNCVEYSPSGDKPYIVSGSDDKTMRVWDYQTKQCIQTLTGHDNNVSVAHFHPTLPIIFSGSEDGSIRVWHQQTYRLETTLNYMLERVWSIASVKGSNNVAIGFDEGMMVLKIGNDEPIVSMNGTKIVYAKGSEIISANLKLLDESSMIDGEILPIPTKDMGAVELFPQQLEHHPNGRVFAVCGDGEFIVYTTQQLRNKFYGKGLSFAWGADGQFATRDADGKITVYATPSFEEMFSFRPAFAVDELFGGQLLGLRSTDFIVFYDWTQHRLIRRIDAFPLRVDWNDAGTSVVLPTPDGMFVLNYDKALVQAAIVGEAPEDDEGIDCLELAHEVNEKVGTGLWIGEECYIFISNSKIMSFTCGHVDTLTHLDKAVNLLKFVPEMNRVFCVDRDLNIVAYTLNLALVQYQAAIIKKEFDQAKRLFNEIPQSMHNRVARFMDHQGFKAEALDMSTDPEHRFELALALGRYHVCADIIRATDPSAESTMMVKGKWKTLGDVALDQGDFDLARECYEEAQDMMSLLLLHSSCGDANAMRKIADTSAEKQIGNVAFLASFLLQDTQKCLQILIDSKRLPEAGFFARAYCPSEVSRVVALWKNDLKSVNEGVANALADPETHPDLFEGYAQAKELQGLLEKQRSKGFAKAGDYLNVKDMLDQQVVDDLESMGAAGLEKAWGISGSTTFNPPARVPETKPVVEAKPVVEEPAVTAVTNGVANVSLEQQAEYPPVESKVEDTTPETTEVHDEVV